MFGDFAEKKETFLTFFFYFNKPCSLKSKKSHFLLFLVKTMPIFRLLRFGQKKTRNNA